MTYQNSDRHILNARAAAKKASQRHRELKLERVSKYLLDPDLCKNCSAALPYSSGLKFCSKSCAAKHNNSRKLPRTIESRQKTSNSLKGRKSPNKGKTETKTFSRVSFCGCKSCGKKFVVNSWTKSPRKTCSYECQIHASVGTRTYQNGTRKPITFFNPFENKDVILDSSWEEAVAKKLIELNIRWIRPKYIKWQDSKGNPRLYYPDFYLPDYDLYLDPKNPYCMEKDQEKMEVVSQKINLEYGHLNKILDKITEISTD